jgi:glutamate N-acetyltransferase/amino-acid N-acetyltransferase
VPQLEDAAAALKMFRDGLAGLCRDLAHQVVRDGEGVTKFVEVAVGGAESDQSAKRIARSIANSPLVKTALAGEDANWGRVVMAVGKAGEPADRDRLSIWFGDHRVAFRGERDPTYSEAEVSAYMKSPELRIRVDLDLGTGQATIWTCDLTAEYVAINADYRS